VEQHVNLAGLPVEAVLLIADGADGAAGSRPEARRIDDRIALLVLLEQVSGTRTSPAMTTRLVVVRVSQATRTVHGSTPVLRASL
jgi:hypothetical protein